MDQVVEAALPAGARVRVWTFARTAEPVYDGTPRQARDLWRLQDEVLKAPPRRARGTRPAAALREIARAAQEADRQGRSSAAILFWDGGDDDPTETARLAGQLARCRGLRAVWVAGIPARSGLTLRAGVERTFRPLQERLLVSGPYDAAAGLDSLRAKAGGN
jgi:hypothetical protein